MLINKPYVVHITYPSGVVELRRGFPTEEAALLHVRRVELLGLKAAVIKMEKVFDIEGDE